MKTLTLRINGMMCENCSAAVHKALSELKQLQNIQVRVKEGTATFTYDEALIPLTSIVEAIEEQGYDVLAPVDENNDNL